VWGRKKKEVNNNYKYVYKHRNASGRFIVHTSKNVRFINTKNIKLAWFFTIGVAFILALLVWELLLSQFILQKPTSQTHGELGRIYGQGLYVQGKEGYGRTFLNELGLRSPSLTDDPPPRG
jgi:hypothetical protein